MTEARKGLVPQTTAQRQAKLTKERKAAGLKRIHLWVHEDDAKAIKEYTAKLQRWRKGKE